MSIEMILILGAIALEIPLAKAIERKARREQEERAGERAKEALQEAQRLRVEEEAREVVRVAHMALERQNARAYGPWLTCLLTRAGEEGRKVTPGIALQAVRMTIADLAGSRFNLRPLWEAEATLEEMKGRGE